MIVYDLPLPPSVNRIWRKSRGRMHRSDQYETWRSNAGQLMLAKRPFKRHSGPCNVKITIAENARGDLDNKCKALLDLLVTWAIIEDDSKRIVRKILMEWGPVDGARIEITAAAEWTPRKRRAA